MERECSTASLPKKCTTVFVKGSDVEQSRVKNPANQMVVTMDGVSSSFLLRMNYTKASSIYSVLPFPRYNRGIGLVLIRRWGKNLVGGGCGCLGYF